MLAKWKWEVWLQSVIISPTLSPRTRLLTGFAVEAAEPLVGVLLVLQAQPELSEGQIFAAAAAVAAVGPLSCRRLGRAARQHQERRGRQDLQRQEEKLGVERRLQTANPEGSGGVGGVVVVRLLHRKPRVSNLRLNLNHLIRTSAVGKQLRAGGVAF